MEIKDVVFMCLFSLPIIMMIRNYAVYNFMGKLSDLDYETNMNGIKRQKDYGLRPRFSSYDRHDYHFYMIRFWIRLSRLYKIEEKLASEHLEGK